MPGSGSKFASYPIQAQLAAGNDRPTYTGGSVGSQHTGSLLSARKGGASQFASASSSLSTSAGKPSYAFGGANPSPSPIVGLGVGGVDSSNKPLLGSNTLGGDSILKNLDLGMGS